MAAAKKPNGWTPYVQILLKDKNVKAGGIYGQDNGAVWWEEGMTMKPEEAKSMVSGLKDNKKFTLPSESKDKATVNVNGDKYMFLKAEPGKDLTARKGPTTLLAQLSGKALVVLLTKDGANPGNVTCHSFVAGDLQKKKF